MTSETIIEIVERTYGISLEELQSSRRSHSLGMVRMVASYLLVVKCGWSRVAVGKFFKKDHSTIIYHIERVQSAIEGYDSKLFSFYEQLDPVLSVKINEIYKIKKEVLDNPNISLIQILKTYIQKNENKEIEPQKLYQL